MKPGRIELTNFQSYRHLEFDYSSLGLALVSGPTKAGKSTLLDALPWILYGTTSKEGAADDVRSWFADEPTTGTAQIELADGSVMIITRKRGKRSTDNDLYFYIERNMEHGSADPTRGKNVLETQAIINETLGVDFDLFCIGSYLAQFSRGDLFFIAKAKDRRDTMEKIADLALAVKLAARTSEVRKETKKLSEATEIDLARAEGKVAEAEQSRLSMVSMRDRWVITQAQKIKDLQSKYENFDLIRDEKVEKIVRQLEELDVMTVSPSTFDEREAQIKKQLGALTQVRKSYDAESGRLHAIKAEQKMRSDERNKILALTDTVCPKCLGPVDNANRKGHLKELDGTISRLTRDIELQSYKVTDLTELLKTEDIHRKAFDEIKTERANNDRLLDRFEALQKEALALRSSVNAYAEHLEAAKDEANPYVAKVKSATDKLSGYQLEVVRLVDESAALKEKISALTWLYDKSFELRGALMQKAVSQVNKQTNAYLERYFDASVRAKFSLTDSDKLDVEINNGGYPCPFKQLSGGERRMLTLSFSVALMHAAQDRAGVEFPLIMLDEALNGLDDGLKVKAFGLLQELEAKHESVLLIDHCEDLKVLFSNRFAVTNTGHSQIERLDE